MLPGGNTVTPLLRWLVVYGTLLIGSAVFGVLLAYVYRWTGRDFWLLKAIGYGGLLVIVHVSMIPRLWEPRLLQIFASPPEVIWDLISNPGWAILSAYFLQRFWGEIKYPTPSR